MRRSPAYRSIPAEQTICKRRALEVSENERRDNLAKTNVCDTNAAMDCELGMTGEL